MGNRRDPTRMPKAKLAGNNNKWQHKAKQVPSWMTKNKE